MTKKMILGSLISGFVLAGCATVPTPPPYVPPSLPGIAVSVVLKDRDTHEPIVGVPVHLNIKKDVFLDGTTNGDGYVLFALPGEVRPFPDSYVVVDNSLNYDGAEVHISPEKCHDGCDNFFYIKRKHVNPLTIPTELLRSQRGAFVGITIPEIAPQCPIDPITNIKCQADNGATPRGHVSGLLFTANYRMYTSNQRAIIRKAYHDRHYTHLVISAFCTDKWEYHGLFPPCKQFAKIGLEDALRELYDDGLIPVIFIMDDDEPNDLTTPLSVLVDNPNLDKSLFRIVVPYWEHFYVGCASEKVHKAFPDALLYYHNPTSTHSGYEDDCYPGKGLPFPGVFEWYAYGRQNWGMQGLLMQTEEIDLNELRGRLADFVASFSTNHLRAPSEVAGMDVVWFEDIVSVYNQFWGGGNESEMLDRADKIVKYIYTPLCEDFQRNVVDNSPFCGVLAGFNSGSRIR